MARHLAEGGGADFQPSPGVLQVIAEVHLEISGLERALHGGYGAEAEFRNCAGCRLDRCRIVHALHQEFSLVPMQAAWEAWERRVQLLYM